MRRIAAHYLRYERRNHTLQTSALVNEAYLRLVDQNAPWQGRAHFFGVAARAMRHILVEHARARAAEKRGGDYQRISLSAAAEIVDEKAADIISVDAALQKLSELDPQQGRVVELRFFGGLTIEETAEAMKISTATVEREWRSARAWLRMELGRA